MLKLRCARLFRLRNVVIKIVGVFSFIKGKQWDFHHKCQYVITKTYATGNARTKSMLYFTSYQIYRKSQIMWFVVLSVAVKALAFEVKIVTVTARFGVFQVFIIKECCRFLHARQYWMVFSIWINVDCDICARTSARVNDGILDKSSDHPLVGYFKEGWLSNFFYILSFAATLFPFWINLVGIRVYQLIFTSRIDVFFDPL